jgi:ubiquinone/menaquinone biosynthesis C-methylase UbiE
VHETCGDEALEWDALYRTGKYLRFWDLQHPSPELVTFLANEVDVVGRKALDIGCGSGRDCILMARSGFQTFGVDLSHEAIKIAKRRAARERLFISLLQADAIHLPFRANYFDLITDRGCFHHLLSEDSRDGYAREVVRLLRPRGRLLLRGCRINEAPFHPITPACLKRHFAEHLFVIGPPLPFDLMTNGGRIASHMCAIQKI